MTYPSIDTDVIIRLLTGDDPQKQAAAAALFEQVEQGTRDIAAPVTVIADAVFVLASPRLYHLPRAQVSALLTRLVSLPHFHVSDSQTVLRALELYSSVNVDFSDALIVATMAARGARELYSYDNDFDRFSQISRQEP